VATISASSRCTCARANEQTNLNLTALPSAPDITQRCLSISLMAALLLVNPLTARTLPPPYSVRKGFGRSLAMLVL
jgi:hypothetical protein